MLSQTHASAAQIVTDVEFPPRAVALLFSGPEMLARSIEANLEPFRLQLTPWSDGVRVTGDELSTALATKILNHLVAALQDGSRLDGALALQAITTVVAHHLRHSQSYHLPGIPHPLRPMTLSQVAFFDAILHSGRNLIFGIGPTGTGKTYLSIAAGLNLVGEAHFKKLVVTRPRVMLEGEIVTPALRSETAGDEQLAPLEDALSDLLGHDEMRRRIDHGFIEIVPLGRLRGRTFNECVIVIDDAQNMTIRNMRMALTRMGHGSRMIVTGDPGQSALAVDEPSGLNHILSLICDTSLALVHRFNVHQIVRNDLVAKIEALYVQSDGPALRDVA